MLTELILAATLAAAPCDAVQITDGLSKLMSELKRAKTEEQLQALLHGKPVPAATTSNSNAECGRGAISVSGVDLFKAQLSDPPAQKTLVLQVRYSGCDVDRFGGMTTGLQAVMLFVPSQDRYCRVPAPTLDVTLGDGYWGPACIKKTFSFENLTSATHAVLAVDTFDQWCHDSGSGRGTFGKRSYVELQNLAPAEIFKTVTADSTYDSPTPPLHDEAATVKPQGKTFPKPLQVNRVIKCLHFPGPDGERRDPTCVPENSSKLFVYENGMYVEKH